MQERRQSTVAKRFCIREHVRFSSGMRQPGAATYALNTPVQICIASRPLKLKACISCFAADAVRNSELQCCANTIVDNHSFPPETSFQMHAMEAHPKGPPHSMHAVDVFSSLFQQVPFVPTGPTYFFNVQVTGLENMFMNHCR